MRACLGIPDKPCAKLISSGSRCPTCRREFARQCKAKGRTGERGTTHASRQRRQRVLERAGHRCYYCTAPADRADHFIPLAKGDKMPGDFMESEWLVKRCEEVAAQRRAAA